MYNPENSHSSHWMRGELERRVDKYTTAKDSGFTKNRFKVKNLRIINSWDGMCTIPETLTINLSRDTAWSFEDNIEIHKTGEGEATISEQGDTHGTNDNE